MTDMDIVEKSRLYAIHQHQITNHFYDGKYPYSFHLDMVVQIARKFIHLIPENDRDEVLAGCWVHDVMEDTRETFNNVKDSLNDSIARYSYALMNEKGMTREERANDNYYYGIRTYKHATFIKLCDRMANMQYSKETGSSMFKKYVKEYDHFFNQLYDGRYQELWDELKRITHGTI